jgi:Fe-S-cluster containining protein
LKNTNQLIQKVSELYGWLDEQTLNLELRIQNCNACGNCCDFDSYGHRLYVTTPELIYLADKLGTLKQMTSSRCPYQVDNKCSIHAHRFASCRIFFCKGNADLQSDLSEKTLSRLKTICSEFDLAYRYTDLKTALGK